MVSRYVTPKQTTEHRSYIFIVYLYSLPGFPELFADSWLGKQLTGALGAGVRSISCWCAPSRTGLKLKAKNPAALCFGSPHVPSGLGEARSLRWRQGDSTSGLAVKDAASRRRSSPGPSARTLPLASKAAAFWRHLGQQGCPRSGCDSRGPPTSGRPRWIHVGPWSRRERTSSQLVFRTSG